MDYGKVFPSNTLRNVLAFSQAYARANARAKEKWGWVGVKSVALVSMRHTWMQHLPHAGAQAPIQMPTIKMPWQNPIPHWISKCLPSCARENPHLPDKTPSRTGVHSHSARAIAWAKHRGHTHMHVTPTSLPLSGITPPPFAFALAFARVYAWQMPMQKPVHFSPSIRDSTVEAHIVASAIHWFNC